MHKLCIIKCFHYHMTIQASPYISFDWNVFFVHTKRGCIQSPWVDYSTIEYPLNKYWEAGRKKHIFHIDIHSTISQTQKKKWNIFISVSLFYFWFGSKTHTHNNEANNPWFTSFYRVTSSLVWGCRLDTMHAMNFYQVGLLESTTIFPLFIL